jgi:ectoine hydroxylase-related dioxygenase (phytanoyl-CoA dioxygenase family)
MSDTSAVLTEEDVWYFKTNGFYHVRETLPEDLVDRLNAATDREVEQMDEPIVWENRENRTPEGVRRLSKILHRDPVYLEAASHPIILDALEEILGPDIEILTNKHNHVMVKPGGAYPVPWHSGEQPYNPTLITALIYMEEATIENGCIRLVPGSHNRPFRKDRRPQKQRDDFRDSENYYRSVPIPMQRGGVLLFDDCCFHGSDANRTRHSRRSLTIGYRAHDSHDVLKNDPEKILARGEKTYTGHPHPFPYPKN